MMKEDARTWMEQNEGRDYNGMKLSFRLIQFLQP